MQASGSEMADGSAFSTFPIQLTLSKGEKIKIQKKSLGWRDAFSPPWSDLLFLGILFSVPLSTLKLNANISFKICTFLEKNHQDFPQFSTRSTYQKF